MINLEVVKLTLKQIGIITNVKYCHDGASALEAALSIARDALSNFRNIRVRPIGLILVDFQMPMKTGV